MSRCLSFYPDNEREFELNIPNKMQNRYLESDETLELKILLVPEESKNVNRVRRVFIYADHPNIIFEVPILGEFFSAISQQTVFKFFVIWSSAARVSGTSLFTGLYNISQ